MPRRVLIGLALFLLAAGCSAGPSARESVLPSPSPVAVPGEDFFLPAGCAEIDLRTPDGELLDLSGRWIGAAEAGVAPSAPAPTDWNGEWIRQTGDCLWAVSYSSFTDEANLEPYFITWSARLTPGFEFVAPMIFVSERDPTFMTMTTYGKVGFDASGLTVICSGRSASSVLDCPDGGEIGVSYRVSDLAPTPSP